MSVENDDTVSVIRVNKKISTLSIESVQAEHLGEYACVVKNRAGATSYSRFLHVNGTYSIIIKFQFLPKSFLLTSERIPSTLVTLFL